MQRNNFQWVYGAKHNFWVMIRTCSMSIWNRIILFENVSRDWNYEIHDTPRIKSESSYNRCPHAGNRFQLSSEFFSSRIIYFDIHLSICVGIQSKWHVRSRYWWFHGEWTCCFSKFCHTKNQNIQNLIHQFWQETPKEHCPEAALYSDTSFSRYKVQTASRVLKPLRVWKITSGHRVIREIIVGLHWKIDWVWRKIFSWVL